MSHTPGPWFVEGITEDSGNPAVLAGASEIGAPGYDSMVASVVGRLSDIAANARLIAAAPEMLSLLRRAVYLLSGKDLRGASERGVVEDIRETLRAIED